MRTFIRDMATRLYFQSQQKWTADRDEAHDFGVISRAVKSARRLHIPGLELVLSLDDPREAATTPFAQFLHGLSHPNKHLTARSGT